ncbi:kinase-like protein [Auriscalpium vulgare]|uniref:Kinase-like protein n=1 Tax=Auriscalpium vulgare TaxID=40419 RepID=A0ACB8S5M8_9AGAM|nr:kinase-like protein [Auriscalpium vulgare]
MVFDAFVHHNVRCELTAMHAITCSADQSPFLTSLISAFQDADFCYAVMHLQGVDLSFHLAQIERRMATREIILYGAELILAIEACHKLGFVHRDIKPANIIVGPGGHITLADYSIACFPKEGVENAVIKDDEQVMASGLTCAPEQLPVGNPYNYKVDIWTFGLVLLELFIGECGPYFRATKGDVFPGEYEILHRNIARDVDLYVDTRAGRDFLKKVLERDPERRLSIEEIKAHPFFHEIDGFTWEKCARGEIPVMFRPERPTGIERFVRNVVPRPETPQLTAAGRYPVALKFDDPIFDFHCAADRLAVDACIYTSWVSDELEEGEVEARGVVSDSLIARASSSAPQGSTESDMDVEIL